MKFQLNPAFTKASGALVDLVFREVRGETIVSRKPDTSNAVYSESQIAHRQRFKEATLFGKSVMADEGTRTLYEALAQQRDLPITAVTIADFFNVPVIHSVNVFGYNGNVGDTITITASDDVGVQRVQVSISDDQDNPIEYGEAVETAAGSGQWIYTATVQGQPAAKFQVVAMDRPGGTAVMNINKTF